METTGSKKSIIKSVLLIAAGVVIAALVIEGGKYGMSKLKKKA